MVQHGNLANMPLREPSIISKEPLTKTNTGTTAIKATMQPNTGGNAEEDIATEDLKDQDRG